MSEQFSKGNDSIIHINQYRINKIALINKETKIINVEGTFSKSSMQIGSKRSKLPDVIGSIKNYIEKYPNKTYYIITSKDLTELFKDFLNLSDKEIGAYHYSQRGGNILVDMLFIVITPFIPPYATIFKYVLTFNEYPEQIVENRDESGHFLGFKNVF